MKKNMIRIILGFAALQIITSCIDNIVDLNVGETYSRLVVEGYVTTDTIRQKVILSKSMDLFDQGAIPFISNAQVSISDGLDTFTMIEDVNNKGTYLTDSVFAGIPGRTYSLLIRNVDVNNDGNKEEYSASSELKRIGTIDSVSIKYEKSNPHQKGWLINLYAQDQGGRNFYLIKVIKNGVLLTDSVFKYSFTENVGFEGKYYDGFPVYFLREDSRNERLSTPPDTVTVEMCSITEGYYQFIYDFILEYYPKVPIFSGPSANISTNIEPHDKASGYFAAYGITRKTTIYR